MKKSHQLVLMFIPILISVFGAFSSNIKTNILVGLISIAIMLILVLSLDICKREENLWSFVLIFFITTPMHIRVLMFIKENTFLLDYPKFIAITISILVFFTLQSVSEIVFGVIVRIIRPKQYDFDD